MLHAGPVQVRQAQAEALGVYHLRERERDEINSICFSESRIRYDHYLIPFTLYELGLLYKQQGDAVKATTYIENAK